MLLITCEEYQKEKAKKECWRLLHQFPYLTSISLLPLACPAAVARASLTLGARAALAAEARGEASAGRAAFAAGRGPFERLRRDFDAVNALIKQYNNAVLADRESFGRAQAREEQLLLSPPQESICLYARFVKVAHATMRELTGASLNPPGALCAAGRCIHSTVGNSSRTRTRLTPLC